MLTEAVHGDVKADTANVKLDKNGFPLIPQPSEYVVPFNDGCTFRTS